jgi:hypothetical protein
MRKNYILKSINILGFSVKTVEIKSRKLARTGHLVCIGKMPKTYDIPVSKLSGRDHLGDLVVKGKIVLK